MLSPVPIMLPSMITVVFALRACPLKTLALSMVISDCAWVIDEVSDRALIFDAMVDAVSAFEAGSK